MFFGEKKKNQERDPKKKEIYKKDETKRRKC